MKFIFLLAGLVLAGCAVTPTNEQNVLVCGLAVQAATGASDTAANALAAAAVLATNPACIALDQATLAAVKSKVAPATK